MAFKPTNEDKDVMRKCMEGLWKEIPDDRELSRVLDSICEDKKTAFFKRLFARLLDPVTEVYTFVFFGAEPTKMRRNQALLLVTLIVWSLSNDEQKSTDAFSALAALNEGNLEYYFEEFDKLHNTQGRALKLLGKLHVDEKLEDAAVAYMHTVYVND